MMNPFEDAYQPEPTENDWLADSTPETDEDDQKENKNVAAQNNEGKLTVTLKGGSGFDSPWIVIHADDAKDALEQMKDPALKELMELTKKAGAHFSGEAAKPAQRAVQSQDGPKGRPAGAGDVDVSGVSEEKKHCIHGPRQAKSGQKEKNGEIVTWRALFCPSRDRSDQCKPVWLN